MLTGGGGQVAAAAPHTEKDSSRLAEERIESATELLAWHAVPLELEHKWAGVGLKFRASIGCQHEIREEFASRKSGFDWPAWAREASLLGEGGNCDRLPHLEAHFKIFRDPFLVLAELIGCRWPVEGRIITDGAKERFTVVNVLAILT